MVRGVRVVRVRVVRVRVVSLLLLEGLYIQCVLWLR